MRQWPSCLRCRDRTIELLSGWKSGGQALSGSEQRIYSDIGFWSISLSGIKAHDREKTLAYRALHTALRAGEEVLLPICDPFKHPKAGQDGFTARFAAAAALRATNIDLIIQSEVLVPGSYFSISDRLYQITDITILVPKYHHVIYDLDWRDDIPWQDWPQTTARVTIKPGLRAAAATGTQVEVSHPNLRCRLKSPESGSSNFELLKHLNANLDLVESM